jgi:ribonuclease R
MGTGMAVDMALRTHEIPYVWPPAVEKQVSGLKEQVPEEAKAGRVDLRSCRWSLLTAKMPATSMTRCTARRNAAAAGACG